MPNTMTLTAKLAREIRRAKLTLETLTDADARKRLSLNIASATAAQADVNPIAKSRAMMALRDFRV